MWYWRYNSFILSRDLTRLRNQSFMQLYVEELLEVNRQPANSGGHMYSGSSDLMF